MINSTLQQNTRLALPCPKAILKLQGPWTHYDNSTLIGASTDPGINKLGGKRGGTLILGNFLHEKYSWYSTVVEFLSSMLEILGSIPGSASSPHNKMTEKDALRWACTHHPCNTAVLREKVPRQTNYPGCFQNYLIICGWYWVEKDPGKLVSNVSVEIFLACGYIMHLNMEKQKENIWGLGGHSSVRELVQNLEFYL